MAETKGQQKPHVDMFPQDIFLQSIIIEMTRLNKPQSIDSLVSEHSLQSLKSLQQKYPMSNIERQKNIYL